MPAAQAQASVPELESSFVLYPTGSDGRKNVETLVRAFALLPEELRSTRQLVLVGQLPELTANHFRHLAALEGIGNRVLVTGHVSEETMLRLYQATELLCFPSLVEGYGLPVAEAMACGAVAVVSDVDPLRDLVEPDGPFRSSRSGRYQCRNRAGPVRRGLPGGLPQACLGRADDLGRRREQDGRGLRSRAGTARPALAAAAPSGRDRLAVSPRCLRDRELQLPPGRGAGAQRRARHRLLCRRAGPHARARAPHRRVSRSTTPAGFARMEAATAGYDEVVYVLGNSEFHAAALASLRRRRGNRARARGAPERLVPLRLGFESRGARRAVRHRSGASTGRYCPKGWPHPDEVTATEAERYGLLMAREVIAPRRPVPRHFRGGSSPGADRSRAGSRADASASLPFATELLRAEGVPRPRSPELEPRRAGPRQLRDRRPDQAAPPARPRLRRAGGE